MAHFLMWTALWPLLGGIGCLAELVSFQSEDTTTETPKLSLFIQNEPLQSHQNHTNSYLQSFSHKILNDIHNSRNTSSQRRAKSDLRTRPREGRGKVDDVDNYPINIVSKSKSNADQYKHVHDKDHEQSQQQTNFVYSSFYENHPLIQKLTDTKPQKFLAGDSHIVGEELASVFSPEKGIPLPLQGNNLNVDTESWTPAWYTNLYEAGKNFNSNTQNLQSNDTKPKIESGSRNIGSESWKPTDSEYRESRFPGYFATAATVPSVSPSTDSSFNVGYSIGVSNSQDPRSSRMLIKSQQHSETQEQPAYSSPLQRPPSLTSATASSRRPEFAPEIITMKPENGNHHEPYRYELVGDNSVWKHLTPNIEMSLSTTAKPHYSHESVPRSQNLNHNVANIIPTNGHTTPSNANGQAFYFYTGQKGSGGDKSGPSSFDHNHALGQSNNFDFSNAMVTLPANLAASSMASQQTAERGYASVAEHIQRENKKFEEQLKNMLEGKVKTTSNLQLVTDNSLAAQTLRPRNVSLAHAKPRKIKPDPHHAVMKNSIQSVIIPLPNGKSLHMPAIIIPLGPIPGFEAHQVGATSSPLVQVTNPLGMHVINPSGIQVIQPSAMHVVSPSGLTHAHGSLGFQVSNPSAFHHVPSPSGTHLSNPSVFQHETNPSGYKISNPFHVTYQSNSAQLTSPVRSLHSQEDNKLDDSRQHTRGNAGGIKNYLPQRPHGPKIVKLQQPKLKKPKHLNVGTLGAEETQVIHVMPKHNQVSPTQHSPTASSYVYYTLNESPSDKQHTEHDTSLLAAGTSLLNAVLLPLEKDSSESFDLSTEATEYIPATSYQNFISSLKHEPLKLDHSQVNVTPSEETSASTVQPGALNFSIPGHRKRRTKSKKRKKAGTNTTVAAPSSLSMNQAMAATAMEPDYAYGYGLLPVDESYANLYSSLQSSFPSKGSLSYQQPSGKPLREQQSRAPSREHSWDSAREHSRDSQREHSRRPSRGHSLDMAQEHSWDQQRDHSWDFPREHSLDHQRKHLWDHQGDKSQDSQRRPSRGHIRHHRRDHMLDYMNSLSADTNEYFRLNPERDASRRVQTHRGPSSLPPAFQQSVLRRKFIF